MNQNNTKYVHKLIGSYSALLLIVMVMGLYLYNLSIQNVGKEIRTQTKLTLEKSVNDMDTAFTTMDAFAGQIVGNSDVVNLANLPDKSTSEFYLRAYHAKEDLSIYVFTESILPIISTFIHIQATDYLLSYSQFTDTELYFINTRGYYKDKYRDWLTMLKDPNSNRKFIPLDQYKRYSDSTYLYKLPLTEYSLKKVPATLCFEMDYERLGEIFSELNLFDTGYLYALDAKGKLTFSIPGQDSSGINQEIITNLSFTDSQASFQLDGNQMFVTSEISEVNEWQYYLVQPADAALYSLTQYRNIFIAIILIGLLFEVLLILYLSKSNVKKIRQLGSELEDTLQEQETLKMVAETQKPIIRQTYLRKILHGNIATDLELEYAREYLAIDSSDKKFTILYLTAYVNQVEIHEGPSVTTGPEDISYYEIIKERLNHYFSNPYIFSPKDGEYALLLASDIDEKDLLSCNNVKAAFTSLHKELSSDYAIWTLAGLGDWHRGLMITWKSYQQAYEAISYCTKRTIFKSFAFIERDTTSFYYPVELTNQLTNFISTGNKSQVLVLFEILRHENMEERSLPIQRMKFLLSDIMNSLYKVRFTIADTEENMEPLQAIDSMFNKHTSLKLCEDIAVNLSDLFNSTPESNQLIKTIQHYIDENFHDPSMCLTKISNEFSISESYFSFRFKEEIGVNFSAYLERARLNHAYKLLKESESNVCDICNEVGYNNSHTFRRAFKKIYGLSPKEARVNSRNE